MELLAQTIREIGTSGYWGAVGIGVLMLFGLGTWSDFDDKRRLAADPHYRPSAGGAGPTILLCSVMATIILSLGWACLRSWAGK